MDGKCNADLQSGHQYVPLAQPSLAKKERERERERKVIKVG
jgi:hypothetical protein